MERKAPPPLIILQDLKINPLFLLGEFCKLTALPPKKTRTMAAISALFIKTTRTLCEVQQQLNRWSLSSYNMTGC